MVNWHELYVIWLQASHEIMIANAIMDVLAAEYIWGNASSREKCILARLGRVKFN